LLRPTALLLASALLATACGTSDEPSDPLQVAATLEAAKPAVSPAQPQQIATTTDVDETIKQALQVKTDNQLLIQVGDRQVQLDRLRSAVFDRDGDKNGAGLRAGDGATNAVADEYDRVLVVDTRGGELMAFSVNPLIMRQRYPVPGAPYGIAYDAKRDIAWVTLTEKNEVVGFHVAGGEPVEKYRFATVRQPNSVATDEASGRVYVASGDNGGIQVISP
jgi:DNA-binding beta-propeller fold protein YncE